MLSINIGFSQWKLNFRLFKNFPSEVVEFCTTCDTIQPMDIVNLCHHYHQKEAGFLDQFMCGKYRELLSSERFCFYVFPVIVKKKFKFYRRFIIT